MAANRGNRRNGITFRRKGEGSIQQNRTMKTLIIAIVALSLLIGCNALQPGLTPAQQITVLNQDIAVVRAVIQAQPPGPRRDALLKQLDAVSNYTTLAAVLAQLATTAGVPTPTVERAAAAVPEK